MEAANIKPCPFCGAKGKTFEDEHKNQCGSEYGDFPYVVVVCVSCRCKGTEIPIKHFNMFSDYTVEQFRSNRALRAKEEDRYEDYLNTKKTEAINVWNKRAL